MKGAIPIIAGALIVLFLLFVFDMIPASLIGATETGYINENWEVSSTKSFNIGSTCKIKLGYVNSYAMRNNVGMPYISHLYLNANGKSTPITNIDIDYDGVYIDLSKLGKIYYLNGEYYACNSGGDVFASINGYIEFTETTTTTTIYPTSIYTTSTIPTVTTYSATTSVYNEPRPTTTTISGGNVVPSCGWNIICHIDSFISMLQNLFTL